MNRLAVLIAGRYLISRKSRNAVNIITGIALAGYAIGAFALLTILSALNGFERLLFDVYNDFNPDLKITGKSGKVFHLDEAALQRLRRIPGVTYAATVLEDNAVLQAGNQQVICTLKGVDSAYMKRSGLIRHLVAGSASLEGNYDMPGIVLGEGLEYRLSLNRSDALLRLNAFVPARESTSLINPDINELNLAPSGIIRMDDEISNRYALILLEQAEELFNRESEFSQIEVFIDKSHDPEVIQRSVAALLGSSFEIKDRKMQNMALYKMFRTEKWATFAILCFVLGIISFNLTGALSMLVIEKKEDISILHVLGARPSVISKIFLFCGILIAVSGAVVGIGLSIGAILLQQQFGLITMNSAIVPYYPVVLKTLDILMVLGVTLLLGTLSAIYPAWRAVQKR